MKVVFFALFAAIVAVSAIDLDGDGFHSDSPVARFRDCCDTVLECDDPFVVNPGAFDYFGDGVVNNCGVDNPTPSISNPQYSPIDTYCDYQPNVLYNSFLTGPSAAESSTRQLAFAMDICEEVSDDDQPEWGFLDRSNVVVSLANNSRQGYDPAPAYSGPNSNQVSIVKRFGRIKPVRDNLGGSMMAISTGTALDTTMSGNQPPSPGYNTGDDVVPLTRIYGTTTSSFTDVCGKPSSTYDSLAVTLTMRQPTNAHAFSFKVKMLSTQIGTAFPPTFGTCPTTESVFALLKNTSAYTPADQNIAADKHGHVISNTNPNTDFWVTCSDYDHGACKYGPTDLENLGYAAASDWIAVGTAADYSEVFTLKFLTYARAANVPDVTILIDDFQLITERRQNTPYGYQYTSDLSLVSYGIYQSSSNIICPGTNTVTLQYVIFNWGNEVANDVTISFTPPLGTKFSTGVGPNTLNSCTVYQASAPYNFNSYYKCRSSTALQPQTSTTGLITFTYTNIVLGQKLRFRLTASSSSIDVDYGNNFKVALLYANKNC